MARSRKEEVGVVSILAQGSSSVPFHSNSEQTFLLRDQLVLRTPWPFPLLGSVCSGKAHSSLLSLSPTAFLNICTHLLFSVFSAPFILFTRIRSYPLTQPVRNDIVVLTVSHFNPPSPPTHTLLPTSSQGRNKQGKHQVKQACYLATGLRLTRGIVVLCTIKIADISS